MKSRAPAKLDKNARRRVRQFSERRDELAQAALQTLAELGYARTSIREIAQNSEFSHGVLHYYFTDKVDLILCSVRQYKTLCITRYDRVTVSASNYQELMAGFLKSLGDSLREDAKLHRLWYDIRARTLFEAAFHAEVADIDKSLANMIWRVVSRFAEFTGEPQTLPPSVIYAVIDGLFQQAMLKYFSGDSGAIPQMQADVRLFLSTIAKDPLAVG
jgi:AcrR family transcriptional regulator